MSTLHFIGGEKGGVGKSVVARLIAQRCIDKQLSLSAFDADQSHGALLRHYADCTAPVDLSQFESADQMVTAAMNGSAQVIVDLPAQSERLLFSWLDDADILGFAAESNVAVMFWHVMDDGKESMLTLERLLDRCGKAAGIVIVKNYGRGRHFNHFEGSELHKRAEEAGATMLELAALYAPVMQKIDQHDASFWAAAYNPDYAPEVFSLIDRQRVKVWLDKANRQFDKLEAAL